MIRLLLLLLCLFAPSAFAAEPVTDYHDFARIPMLHEGRIKPLDSFARIELKAFSGSDSFEGRPAIAWLAEALFDPAEALGAELFHVPSRELRMALELAEEPGHRYRLEELTRALEKRQDLMAMLAQKEDNALTRPERELLQLSARVNEAAELFRSFSLLLPLAIPENLKKPLGLPGGDITYLQLTKAKEALLARVRATAKAKGESIERYTQEEQLAAMLALQLNVLEATGSNNKLVRVLPSPWGGPEWFSPWALLTEGKAAPETGASLEAWQELARSYREQDNVAWQKASQALYSSAPVARWRLELEHWYYALHLIEAATILYALAFVLFLIPASSGMGIYALGGGLAIHAAILLSRMLILGRPPVSTLYESILFVSFIIALAARFWPGQNFRKERLLAASGLGAALLTVSHTYASGDTMGVLVAVLNTNFWLATHVICITAGYGWCLVAGTLAHFSLFREARRTKGRVPATPPGYLLTLAIIALLFTALGTILGGIWADQSWGRFWGWDPKENGALLIVLWLIWLLHSRVSGHAKNCGFTALLALLNVVVALSWFGVNLLNTGLHSYGFTHAAALGLGAFCAAEFVFVGVTYVLARRRA